MKNIVVVVSMVFAFFYWQGAMAKVVHYDLTIAPGKLNLSGKEIVDFALTVNGGIPAPTLEFTEGDEAEIVVRNQVPGEEVSLHWHGILLPPEEDGVAYVNTPPIFYGTSRTFRFPIRQNGTYWYHSHTMLQEQKGVLGAIVIHPKKKQQNYDREAVVLLSDWTDENPDQVLRNLRKDGDYYQFKKQSKRSYFGALRAGGLWTLLKGEWQRMGGMDLSDVGYDAFLINGRRDSHLLDARPGERVRLRVINAGASSYFYLALGDIPFQVISADGIDIEPVVAKEILLGMAETYDILFTMPSGKSMELRATAQDVTGHASAWIGTGEKVFAPDKAIPDFYAPMDHGGHNGHTAHTNHQAMDHSQHEQMTNHASHAAHQAHHQPALRTVDTLQVDDVRAVSSTVLPSSAPMREVKLVLGGSMERYVWFINGKAIHEERNIDIKEGELVRFIFENSTMMHHPIHLHGHFFRVINQFGERSPLKHTVDVPPHGTRTIEFFANEPGEWMLHCHNLYHMKTGMARVVSYMNFRPKASLIDHRNHDPHMHEHLYWDGLIEAATNRGRFSLRASKTWDTLELEAETRSDNRHWEIDGDFFYRRWMGQFWNLVGGATTYHSKWRAIGGLGATLPMLVEANFLLDHRARFRVDLKRKFQWTSLIFSEVEAKFRQHERAEWGASLMLGPNWHWAAGFNITEDKVGVGARYRF